jgi:hypothetical protein
MLMKAFKTLNTVARSIERVLEARLPLDAVYGLRKR